MRPSQPLLTMMLLATCCLITGCGNTQSTTTDNTLAAPAAKSTSSTTAITVQNLNNVASVPVINTTAPATMTMVTSVSSTVAVPVYITAGDHPDTHSVAEIGHIGHIAESIALTNTMLESISQGMQAANPDVAFVKSMMAHHEGAIALAQIELKYGQDEVLRKLAQDIILMRSNEVRWMVSWLNSNADIAQQTTNAATPTPLQQEYQYTASLKEMYEQMVVGINQDNADAAFAQSMIPHHKGALAMSQIEFKYGNDDKIRALADSIIVSQQGEIALLQQWLKTHSLRLK